MGILINKDYVERILLQFTRYIKFIKRESNFIEGKITILRISASFV